MNILVIEDNEYKFKQIEESLKRILKNPDITCMDSMSAGLVSFRVKNVRTNSKPYHLVITDNYLPIDSIDENDMFERDADVVPCASSIVSEIRRQGFRNIPIIVCSSEEVEECDYNYFIKYDSSVSLNESFRTIFSDFSAYMSINNLTLESIVCPKSFKKTKLNYMSTLSKTEPVKKIPFSSSKMEELDRSIRAKCKQNHSSDHILINDEIYYAGNNKQVKDCRPCQNMSCRVVNSEKTIEDCLEYINHEKEQGPVKKLVPNNKK